jgi:hypothetical protein
MNARGAAALLLIAASTAPARSAGAPIRLVVAVSTSQSVNNLSSADLRRIYVGDMTRWPDGHRIVPVMLPTRSRASEVFLKRVVRMSSIDFAQEWISVVFRGRAPAPPVVVATAAEALDYVAVHHDAIAVISDDVSPAGIRSTPSGDSTSAHADRHPGIHIINIDGRTPQSSEYPLNW